MTVSELIQELARFPQGAEILCTWEGVLRDITPETLYQAKDGGVLIDADENAYKEKFLNGSMRTR